MQLLIENLLVLAAKGVLGLFLSAIIGVTLYLITVPVVLSIWEFPSVNYPLVAVLSIGTGAGMGSFLAWLDRERRLKRHIVVMAVVLACAYGGACGGLARGEGIYQLGGMPGIPALSVAIIGAVLGANIPALFMGAARALRDPRI